MSKKKKENTKDDSSDTEMTLDDDLDFVDDLDIEEEIGLLDADAILDREEHKRSDIIDKDEELKQLYLSCGIHIGTKLLTGQFREHEFYYRQTHYGLWVIDIQKTQQRIKTAAKFLSKYVEEGSDKVIVSSVRRYGKEPVKKFCEALGCMEITTRFIPGSLTNPIIDTYIKDASVVVIVDPHADKVILREARLARVPVVSLFDSDDTLTGIDLAIPANNRGKKALGLAFWLLARHIMLELGKISSEEEFPYTLDEFTSNITPVYQQDQRRRPDQRNQRNQRTQRTQRR